MIEQLQSRTDAAISQAMTTEGALPRRTRPFRLERPDSMKGPIDQEHAQKLIGPDERKEIRRMLGPQCDSDTLFRTGMDEAGQWIEYYLKSAHRQKPPSFKTQATSRKALSGSSRKLLQAMEDADKETKKRTYHFLADNPPAHTCHRKSDDDDYRYGRRILKTIRDDLALLERANRESERTDSPKGQVEPATYLFYRLSLIWTTCTSSEFTTTTRIHNRQGWLTAVGFFSLVLQSVRGVSASERKMLKDAAAWKNSKLLSTLVAVHRKITGQFAERDSRAEEKRMRSDSDQGR